MTVSRQDPACRARAVLDAMRQPAARCPPVGVQAGADYTVARLEKVEPGGGREPGEPVVRSLWPAENEAVVRMLREQYKVQVPASADAIKGEQPASAG